MTNRHIPRRGLILVVAAALAACGGDEGSQVDTRTGVIPAPAPPTPPTPPPPAPSVAASIFGALGQTTSQSLASLGFGYSGVEVGGFGDLAIEASSVDPNYLIGFRVATPSQLLLSLGGIGEDPLVPNGGGGIDSNGQTVQRSYSVLGGNASLSLLAFSSGVYLTSSALGSWTGPPSSGPRAVYRVAQFAYGVPTPVNEMPNVGSANYDTQIYGPIALSAPGDDAAAYYSGTARLSVNFATGTVSGTIELGSVGGSGPPITFTLSQAVLNADKAGFQGQLTSVGGGADGFIQGLFTGRTASEMIVRWRSPVVQVGGRSGPAFGVWGARTS